MSKKKLGVLGGMGPLATAIFYEMIVKNTYANSDQEHIYTIIASHGSIPDRSKVILDGEDKSIVIDAVKEDLKLFETADISNIAIPCNTFHFFYDDVQKETNIPIINMVDEALKESVTSFGEGSTVMILGTDGTLKTNVYEKYAEKYPIKLIRPDAKIQKIVMKSIYDIKETGIRKQDQINDIIEKVTKDNIADGIILACTELSLVELTDENQKVSLDAMFSLVKQSIIRSGYDLIK
ncbi:MAG: aspartate/glutamate racemase family protein [Tissierellia bacterium]|nr:aspartate/glutamate racemase family protein [Tissierellia bacterium]